MAKILNTQECDEILNHISSFEKNVREYCNDVRKSIETFNNNSIVQDFYASGKLGREMEDEINKMKASLQRYYDSISDRGGLISVTEIVIKEQKELLNSSYKGGN